MSNTLRPVSSALQPDGGAVIDDLPAYHDFHDASQAVIAFLRQYVGFGLWMVTRTGGDDWIIFEATPNQYGMEAGQVLPWRDSFCSRMVEGAPHVAPRDSVGLSHRRPDLTLHHAVAEADEAMYRRKRARHAGRAEP